ncbi:response regulator transcription factor [Aquibacillus saliphilus]|uniref:response regulator transcription factor n=1 Tax=Aquibacillus saliphilus TaxID=1909422 RepID=UPI001CF09DCF|nr:response regulator transcription factor [Aquibacillus saliphilus]
MKMMIIKEPSLLREGMLNVLRESFGEEKIVVYGSDDLPDFSKMECKSDLIIIDCDTDIDILSSITYFRNQNKKIIVWTSSLDNHILMDLFKLDLDGYFYNGMEKEELLSSIMSVFNGKQFVHPSLSTILLGDYVRINKKIANKPVGILSNREWEVLELLTKGCKNEQIGTFLFISEKTVKGHVSNIMKKMDVPDRTNVVLTALRNKWVVI